MLSNYFLGKISKPALLAVIFTAIFNVPIAYYDMVHFATPIDELVMQLNFMFITSTLVFFLLSILPILGPILAMILNISASLAVYFLFSFGKTLDPGVVHDIMTVEPELTFEYLSWQIVVFIIFATSLSYFLWEFTNNRRSMKSIAIFLFGLIFAVQFALADGKKLEVTITKYNPINLIYSLQSFFKYYGPEHRKMNDRLDLSEKYSFMIDSNEEEPLIIVYVIGESMRGDINGLNGYHINNMPRLKNRRNLVSMSQARSVATSTRESLPFMLTRALKGGENQACAEKGIISIYRQLGFNTSWISNQGIFGTFELKYAANALEAEKVLTQREIKRLLGRKRLYDGDVLEFALKHLENAPKANHFMVYHMLGSHWQFENRYPVDFPTKFPLQTSRCEKKWPGECSDDQLAGSYHNSITYSDYVLDQLLEHLSDKNAIMFYASDHGMSIGENGVVGNAARGENLPLEQLDIAMFIWASDKFTKQHPNMLKSIEKKRDTLYTNDKLFYSILNCSGVETDLMVDEYSLCK